MIHRLEHHLGWNRGHVVSALDDRGGVWIGFRCVTCGKVTGVHPSWFGKPSEDMFT